MGFTDWISIFMALIAIATALVTYAVYRSATDPVVIVYAQPDLQRRSLVNLFIENIGRGAAHSISFSASRPLPEKAFGISLPEKVPEGMKSGAIVNGVPFLAPGQRISITWGQYGGLARYIGDEPIRVDSFCYRGRSKGIFAKKLRAASTLDIKVFEASESSEHGFGPDLVKQMKALNETLTSIQKQLEQPVSTELDR
ncbi:MAG: hypothetical protein ACOH2T_28780 [Pseudomonas sp.]